MNSIDISIIVLTFNSAETIERCLNSLINQTYKCGNVEILIIDNGSNDATLNIVKGYGIKAYCFPDLTIPSLRNKGVALSNAPIIGFIDSDCEVSSDWVTRVAAHLKNEQIGVVGSKYLLPLNASSFEKHWYTQRKQNKNIKSLIPAGNMATRKDIFELIGGFDGNMITGEDAYFQKEVQNKGFRCVNDPKVKCRHYGNAKSVFAFFKKEIWYGIGCGNFKELAGLFRFEKPLIAAHISLLIIAIAIYNIAALNFVGFIVSLSLWNILAFISAIDRYYNKGLGDNLFFVFLCYHYYLAARLVSLFYIYRLLKF